MRDTPITVLQYDNDDALIGKYTGSIEDVFSNIEGYENYYYRVAALDTSTYRERVTGEHFGIKTSCVGGLNFSIAETCNRLLNRIVKDYFRGEPYCDFRTVIIQYNRLTELVEELEKNKKEVLEIILNNLFNAFPDFKETKDLNECKEMTGLYLLVLDEYNACYLGQAADIKKRIMRHWSRVDYFYGKGLDLFKAKDTTRIFYYECASYKEINELEYKMIRLLPNNYTFNIASGGGFDYLIENGLPLMKKVECGYETKDIKEILMKTFAENEKIAKNFIVP